MSRPIWKGNISFGLVNIPITLYSAEKTYDLHFKLLDSRNRARIHYERINDVTGTEVPWDEVVKAYEYDKGNYVILKDEDFKKAAPEHSQTIEIKDFVEQKSLDPLYFEKPYYLVPDKHAEKGFVLLRETLRRSKKIGIAKVVIRTREYLAALIPYQNALILNVLRFDQELRKPEEFELPKADIKKYKLSEKEIVMAENLVKSMTSKWNPKKYHDEYRDLLMSWIEKKLHGKTVSPPKGKVKERKESAKVIDFMSLLKKSIAEKDKAKKTSKTKARRSTGTKTRKTQARK